MADQLFSFWAVNGSDLDELHLGHVALILNLQNLLQEPATNLRIVFNEREVFGTRAGMSSKNVRAYAWFFEQVFSALGVTDAAARVSVVHAPSLIQEFACGELVNQVRTVLTRIGNAIDDATRAGLSLANLELALKTEFKETPDTARRLLNALRPYLADKETKTIKVSEEMAVQNTALIGAAYDQYQTGAVMVTGKRHLYKYDLSKAILLALARKTPRFRVVPNLSDIRGTGYMRARGGAPPILISAKPEDIAEALTISQRHTGSQVLAQIIDAILRYTGGVTLRGRAILDSKKLAQEDFEDPQLIGVVAEALHRALDTFRRTRSAAYDITRGEYLEFSSAACLQTLSRAFGNGTQNYPKDVNEDPLRYREDFLQMQERALRYAQDLMPPGMAAGAPTRLRNLALSISDVDVLSYFTSKRYRDHHIHVVNVLYTGWVLLSLRLTDGRQLKEHVADALRWKCEMVESAWVFAALLHDHCYPLAFALSNGDRLRALFHHFGKAARKIAEVVRESVGTMLGRNMAEVVTHLFEEPTKGAPEGKILGLVQKYFGPELTGVGMPAESRDIVFDHGILSAVNMVDYASLDGRPERSPFAPESFVLEAARSVLLHNLSTLRKTDGSLVDVKIDFSDNPLGALLVLCDEMQEWGRTCLGTKGYETMIGNMSCGPIDHDTLDAETLRCMFQYSHAADKNFHEWNFDLFAHGKCRNLRRIQFASVPFPKKFQFSVGIHGMSVDLRV